MAYTNRKFNWDFDKLKRFRDKYVTDSIIKNGPAFDLSAYNAVGGTLATYEDLSAALTALNALPAAYKKGGMSFKFVQSSDNKYVQCRLKAESFTTNIDEWQDDDIEKHLEPIIEATCKEIYGYVNHYVTPTMSVGYVDKNGNVYSSVGYHKTNKIPVKSGDSLIITRATNSRFWTYYDNNGYVSGAEYGLDKTIPNGVTGVIISFDDAYIQGTIQVTIRRYEVTGYENNANDDIQRIEDATCNVEYGWNSTEITPTLTSGYIDQNGVPQSSDSYKKTNKISVKSGQRVVVKNATNVRLWSYYKGNDYVSGAEYGLDKTIPDNVDGVIISFDNTYITGTVKADIKEYVIVSTTNNAFEVGCGLNILNPSTVSNGKYMTPAGVIGDGDYFLTDYIAVEKGDILICGIGNQLNSNTEHVYFVYVTAFDSSKNVIQASGSFSQREIYTVPEGVAYVRCTMNRATIPNNCMMSRHGERIPYVPYEETTTVLGGHKQEYENWRIKNEFISSVPGYVRKNLAYKPLGQLDKAYVCLTTDDGLSMLTSYTIPMCIQKGVPLTMAFWTTSEVLVDTDKRSIVMDAVNNHGFVVSRHDLSPWIPFSESQLTKFFDIQEAAFDAMGIELVGACYPFAQVSPLLCAYAGSRFGVARSAYSGVGPNRDALTIYGSYFVNTGKSNMYALSSVSIADWDLDTHKESLDWAIANGGIVMKHWHDNDSDLTPEVKTTLEAFIDYCLEKNVQFITLADIPYLPFTKADWEHN